MSQVKLEPNSKITPVAEPNVQATSVEPSQQWSDVPFGKRISVLDGVRGVAVLMVLVFHTTGFGGLESAFGRGLHMATGILWCGVDLFFVLSGFLITGILIDSRESPHYFRNFYARRTLRIFPLYYAVLVGVVFIVPLAWYVFGLQSAVAEEYMGRIVRNQGYLWTYTQNYLQATGKHTLPGFGHFWTLAIEEQFYLAWPLVVFFLPRHQLGKLCVAIMVSVLALRIGLYASGVSGWAIRQWTFTRFDSLVMGAWVAYIVRSPSLCGMLKPHLKKIMLASILCVIGILMTSSLKPEDVMFCTVGYTVLAVLFGSFILDVTTANENQQPRYLDSTFLRAFGKYSYAIYVFHWPITHGVRAAYEYVFPENVVFGNPTIDAICRSFSHLILVTTICFFLAILSWNLWEKHFLRFKKLFDYQPATKKPSITQ